MEPTYRAFFAVFTKVSTVFLTNTFITLTGSMSRTDLVIESNTIDGTIFARAVTSYPTFLADTLAAFTFTMSGAQHAANTWTAEIVALAVLTPEHLQREALLRINLFQLS